MAKTKIPFNLSRKTVDEIHDGMRRDIQLNHDPLEIQKRREKIEEQERENFVKQAVRAGFSKKQAEFLRDAVAMIDHGQWDGRIG